MHNEFDEFPYFEDGPKELRERFSITPLLDIEINAGAMGWVGLTPEADHDLRLDVTSAVIARFMGTAPRTARKYMEGVPEHTPRDELVRTLTRIHLRHYDEFYQNIGVRDGPIGLFAFDMAMVRSRASIELMLITARQGFLLEPCLIARSLMEQFAYAVHVWETDDDSLVFESKPQSLIRFLHSASPHAGRAYGLLSRLCHYDPKMHYAFIGGNQKNWKDDESGTVVQRSWRFKITSLAWVFFVLDLKYQVFKQCYGSHPKFEVLSPIGESIERTFDEFFDGVDLPAIREVRALLTSRQR
jgi:hypothetical protein